MIQQTGLTNGKRCGNGGCTGATIDISVAAGGPRRGRLLDLARRKVDTEDCHWVEQKFRRLQSMAIIVVCPNCRARLRVSEKCAGQQKPCPKCKELIDIPAEALEVIIHEPEPDEGDIGLNGPRKKRPAVKLLPRTETPVPPLLLGGILATIALAFVLAVVLRSSAWHSSIAILALGAAAIAPALVLAGYLLLQNQELEPYTGRELAARVAICAAIYTVLWGVTWGLKSWVFPADAALENWNTVFLLAAPLAIGTTAAWGTLDLDPGSGFFHYCLYLIVCILLRLTLGLAVL